MPESAIPWKSLFDDLVLPAMVLDPDHGIRAVNHAILESTGHKEGDILQQKCYQIFHNRPEGPPLGCPMVALLAGEGTRTVEMEVEACHGFCLVSCTPVFDDGGSLQAIMHVAMDISERKRAEEELSRYRENLEEMVSERTHLLEDANQELEAFCYSVSHDLRAPLRHVDGFLGLLKEDYGELLGEGGRVYVERASSSVVQMGSLIDDLLRLSRYSRAPISPQEVDLCRMVRGIASELEHEMKDVRLDVSPGLTIHGDPALLKVVLTNLLENACKYSSSVSCPVIEVGVKYLEGETVYYVRDNGVGFNMDHAGKLFKPFERLHGQDEFPGNGVGLASVQRIITRHGGRIWADGRPGEGATFYFTVD